MRDLLEVTITCPGCTGRVPVHLDGHSGARLVGRCTTCDEIVACSLRPDPEDLELPVTTAGGAHR